MNKQNFWRNATFLDQVNEMILAIERWQNDNFCFVLFAIIDTVALVIVSQTEAEGAKTNDEFRKLFEWFVEQKTTRNRTTIGVSRENEEFSAAIVRETCFFPFSGNRTQKRRNKNNSRQIHAQTHKWWICLLQNFDRVNFCWSFFPSSRTLVLQMINTLMIHLCAYTFVSPYGTSCGCLCWYFSNSTFVSTWNARFYHTVVR